MKPRWLVAGLAAASCCSAGSASSRESEATGSASATIIQPISATALADLSFGGIALGRNSADGGAGGGAVIVLPQETGATYAGSARQQCGGQSACQPHPARFAVRGEAGRAYRIAMPSGLEARGTRSGAALAVSALTVSSVSQPGAAGGLTDASGRDTFSIGGTLLVPPGTPADVYRAEFAVTVSYD